MQISFSLQKPLHGFESHLSSHLLLHFSNSLPDGAPTQLPQVITILMLSPFPFPLKSFSPFLD